MNAYHYELTSALARSAAPPTEQIGIEPRGHTPRNRTMPQHCGKNLARTGLSSGDRPGAEAWSVIDALRYNPALDPGSA
jgi:hypothetical protein